MAHGRLASTGCKAFGEQWSAICSSDIGGRRKIDLAMDPTTSDFRTMGRQHRAARPARPDPPAGAADWHHHRRRRLRHRPLPQSQYRTRRRSVGQAIRPSDGSIVLPAPEPKERTSLDKRLHGRTTQQRHRAYDAIKAAGVLKTPDRIPRPQPCRGKDRLRKILRYAYHGNSARPDRPPKSTSAPPPRTASTPSAPPRSSAWRDVYVMGGAMPQVGVTHQQIDAVSWRTVLGGRRKLLHAYDLLVALSAAVCGDFANA